MCGDRRLLVAQPRGFIFSAYVGPAHGAITLRGEIDSAAVRVLRTHLDGFLGAAARLISVDASAITSCDPRALKLLLDARRRLLDRGGAMSIVGLHPSLVPARGQPRPVPDVAGGDVVAPRMPASPAPAA
jgi:ABC-type transporter Mla MlaB component